MQPAGGNLKLFAYTADSLRGAVAEVFGTASWYNQYARCAARPLECAQDASKHPDQEFADGVLVEALPRSFANLSPRVRFVDSADEADALLWLVWDYMLCTSAGTSAHEWEFHKQTLVASCPAHVKLLGWLQSTARWRRSGGRDHVFFVSNSAGFLQYPLTGTTRPSKRAGETDSAQYYDWMAYQRWGDARREVNVAAAVLTRVARNSVLVGTEDWRLRSVLGASRFVATPYYAHPQTYGGPMQRRQRDILVSFAGTACGDWLHNQCDRCADDNRRFDVNQLRCRAAAHLSSCGKTSKECAVVDFSVINQKYRNDRTKLSSPASLGGLMRRSRFCLAPRGDTASTKRFYAAILAGCIPVVVADQFVPAFAQLTRVHEAFIRVPEAIFMARNFSLIQTLHEQSAASVRRRQARLACLREAFTYHANRSVPAAAAPCQWVSRAGDAVDFVAESLLRTLAAPRAPTIAPTQPTRVIIFAAGAGSTVLCWMIDQHPDATCANELLRTSDIKCKALLEATGHFVLDVAGHTRSRACHSVMAQLDDVLRVHWAGCAHGRACGFKVGRGQVVPPATFDVLLDGPPGLEPRVLHLDRAAAAASAADKKGTTPGLGWEDEVARLGPRALQLRVVDLINATENPSVTVPQRWTTFNITTANRIAAFLGIAPYQAEAWSQLRAAQKSGTPTKKRRAGGPKAAWHRRAHPAGAAKTAGSVTPPADGAAQTAGGATPPAAPAASDRTPGTAAPRGS